MPANRQGRPRVRRSPLVEVSTPLDTLTVVPYGIEVALVAARNAANGHWPIQEHATITPEPGLPPAEPAPLPPPALAQPYVCEHGHRESELVNPLYAARHSPYSDPSYYRVPPHVNMQACYYCHDRQSLAARRIYSYGLNELMIQQERLHGAFTPDEVDNIIAWVRAESSTSLISAVETRSLRTAALTWQASSEARRLTRARAEARATDRYRWDNERNKRHENATLHKGTVQPPADIDVTAGVNPRQRCECDDGDDCDCGSRGGGSNRGYLHGRPFLAAKGEPNGRLVGIEVETNTGVRLNGWLDKWRGAIHEDGSCGWEAVTTPLGGKHIEACMKDLAKAMRHEHASADDRCGVHVHVDARDIRWHDMRRLLRAYSLVEPVMYLLAGQHRTSQHYCMPCGKKYADACEAEDFKTAIMAVAYKYHPERVRAYARERPDKKDGGRYKGLNIIPWLTGRRKHAPDTTVEFRMHRNSLDGRRLAWWAKVCAELVSWAAKASDAEADALPRSALRALCTVIAPSCAPWILQRVAEWRRVTTSSQGSTRYTAAGMAIPPRRIRVKGGVYSCAV